MRAVALKVLVWFVVLVIVGGALTMAFAGEHAAPRQSGDRQLSRQAAATDGKLVMASHNSNAVFALSDQGLRKSADGGLTWKTLSGPPSRAKALAISQEDATLYAGTEAMGVFKSGDGGETWTQAAQITDSTPNVTVTALAVDPKNPDWIYAAAGYYLGTAQAQFVPLGVYASDDAARSWTAMKGGPADAPITTLVPDAEAQGVVHTAATNGEAHWTFSRAPDSGAPVTPGIPEGSLASLDVIEIWAVVGLGLILLAAVVLFIVRPIAPRLS